MSSYEAGGIDSISRLAVESMLLTYSLRYGCVKVDQMYSHHTGQARVHQRYHPLPPTSEWPSGSDRTLPQEGQAWCRHERIAGLRDRRSFEGGQGWRQ